MAPLSALATLPQRLLLIDDSPSDCRLIREMLVDAGMSGDSVTAVGSLSEARRSMTEETPDCILLDLSLPDASGLEAVAVIASAAPDIPLVVITGRPADSIVYAAMAEGADEYLCKSDIDEDGLVDVLVRATQRRRGTAAKERHSSTASIVLDSIDAPTVALDGSGRIVAVNQAWSSQAAACGAGANATGLGVNYLAVCDQAAGRFSDGAAEAAAGIRSVLHGEVDRFAMDYPCLDEDVTRWFSLRVTPIGELGGGAVLTHLDITPLKQAEEQLRLHEARLHSVFDETAPIFALYGRDGTIQHVSDATTELLGLHQSDVLGEKAYRRIDPSDVAMAREALARVAATPGRTERLEVRVLDGSGRWRELDLAVTNLLDDPKVGAVALTGCDVTEGHLTQIAKRLESRLLAHLPAAVIVTNERGVVVYWNQRATAMYGYQEDEAIGRPIGELTVAPTGVSAALIAREVRTGGRWEGDYEATRADGTTLPVHMTLERIDDDEIGFHGVVGASVDVSERRALENDLAFQAMHDSVTGLPNRRHFVQHLESVLARTGRTKGRCAVLFIDLDDFKMVNDRLGHLGGDQVLRTVGQLIGGALRAGDIVARLGGDEFVVCCDNLDGPEDALVVAGRITEAMIEPFRIERDETVASASIGIALAGPASTAEGLLRNADMAMYAAKQAGKDRVEVFDDVLHAQARTRYELAVQLEAALDAGEIQALFQPEVDLVTGEVVGFEALARWPHAERGMVPPDEFIPVAEECGLIARLGEDVLRQACRALRTWSDLHPSRPPRVAVNVSGRQLTDPAFPATVRRAVDEAGVPAARLCLEVTESTLIDADVAATALWKLKEIGVEIAIDDFGTGYSSLSRLHRFPLDYLKVDRSFVAGMSQRREDAVIVTCILSLARGLGIRAIAEGIEEDAQLEQLAAEGCELGQGWIWSPAVPLDEATALVSSGAPLRHALVARSTVR